MAEKEEFWAELDEVGETEVRVRLATKIYGDINNKGSLAREWLMRKDQARESARELRNEASRVEQIDIARSAKDAAWAAARAAEKANTRATIALIIATISTIIAIVGFILPLLNK